MNLDYLSLHEKVCQCMVVKANPEKHIKQYGSIENFMKQYPVGGIFIGIEIMFNDEYTLEKTRDMIAEYQRYAKVPLLVAADAEMGAKMLAEKFTSLPPCMALGSAGELALAYDYGKAIAKECASIGVNWTLAPVCDLIVNRYNEIVRTRSITDDPELAAKMLAEEVKGFEEHGLLTCGKHFPGDGCDVRNQHIVGTVNNLSQEEWMHTFGKVYKEVFDAGLSAMMVGHISVPAFQDDEENGIYPPATLSSDAMKLLKETLGFQGVAITDAMDMGGFVRWKYPRCEAEVESFKAGMDMMLWPREETADLIEAAVGCGEIPMSRVDDAVSRVAYLKSKLEPFGFDVIQDETDSAFSQGVSAKLADRSSTLASNTLSTIPVEKEKIQKVRIITATEIFLDTREGADALSAYVGECFEAHGAQVEIKKAWDVYLEDYEAGEIDTDYDLIVYCVFANSALPMSGRELVNIHSAQRFDNEKTVVMVIGTPHYISEYFPTAETVIHTYPHKDCLAAAVNGIYGEKLFVGKLPLTI